MSHPKMTSQNPKPLSTAERNLSIDTYLPRKTPSMSNPPILARVTPRSSRSFRSCCASIMASLPRRARIWKMGRFLRRDPDGFGLRIELERVDAHFPPPPRLLHAPEGRSAVEAIPHV